VGSTTAIVLAVVAVVAGFLILRNITDDGGGSASPGEVAESTTSTSDPGAAQSTTTSTTVAELVKQGATVLVANASGVQGSAAQMSTALGADGFTVADPPANATTRLEQSIVYFDGSVASAQAVAESVAIVMGGLTVEAVPTPVPTDGATLAGAGVLVMLGTNQAGKPLAELGASTDSTEATDATGSAPPVAGATTSTTG
jgi:hypothetical protein